MLPPVTDIKLSANFWLSEFLVSQVGARAGIPNTPSPEQLANLRLNAAMMEEVHAYLGNRVIPVSSGLRVLAINRLVGSKDDSAHVQGLATDFTCPSFGTPRAICEALVESPIAFDQLIFEGTWVHIALDPKLKPEYARRQVLTAVFTPGQAVRYVRGIQ